MRTSPVLLLVPLFAASALVLACSGGEGTIGAASSSGSSGDDGSSGNTSSSGGDATTSSSSSSGGSTSSSGGSSGAPPEPVRVGTLTLSSTAYSVGTTPVEIGTATGTFYELPATTSTGTSPCTTKTEGTCEVTSCILSQPAGDAGATIRYTDSGTVTISGVKVNDGSMTLTPGAYGYQTVSGSVAFFTGGETLRFRAPGNPSGAPAFDVTVTAPRPINVTAPPFDAQSRVLANAGKNLPVAWTGTSAGDVVVQMASGTQAKSVMARCVFPGNAGGGSVPGAVFTALSGAGGAGTSFLVSSTSRKEVNANGWKIAVDAQSYGLRGSTIASGSLVIQ